MGQAQVRTEVFNKERNLNYKETFSAFSSTKSGCGSSWASNQSKRTRASKGHHESDSSDYDCYSDSDLEDYLDQIRQSMPQPKPKRHPQQRSKRAKAQVPFTITLIRCEKPDDESAQKDCPPPLVPAVCDTGPRKERK